MGGIVRSQSKVIVVGAFGRSFLLAQELVNLNYQVEYFDLTSSFGSWPMEDIEGPFGFFRSDGLQASDYDLILSGDPYFESPRGFTFYLSTGPFEMNGPLTSYLLEKKVWPGGAPRDWLACYAQHFGSALYRENYCLAQDKSAERRLSSAFYFKLPTRNGFQKQVDELKANGILYSQNTNVADVSFANAKQISLELQGENQGLKNYDFIIWGLTSEETHYYSPRLSRALFEERINEPVMNWQRYRIRLTPTEEFHVLPDHMVMIRDLIAPWTHENQMIFIKTAAKDLVDLWVLQSYVQRFNKEYMNYMGQKIIEHFKLRFPKSDPQIANYPQEYVYSQKELGPPRIPVFQKDAVFQLPRKRSSKLFFQGPEYRNFYFYEDEKKNYQKILKELKSFQLKNNTKDHSL